MMAAPLSILFIPSGPSRIASARIRAYQYVEPLRREGCRCTVFPAMSDVTGKLRIRSPKMHRVAKLGYYAVGVTDKFIRLIPILLLAARHDVIYIQRTTFPAGVPTLLRWINPRIVFDFDDAIHLRDPGDRESGLIATLKERAKSRAVPAILRASRCAIVEHGILEAYAAQHCARVERIAGPIDTVRFSPTLSARPAGPVVIGWMGTPLTSGYLPIVSKALSRLAERHNIEVHLIGSGPFDIPGVRTKVFPWVESEEADRLQAFDIGIMPMPDTNWTRGKLGLKMLLYMAVGIPAVVSYTPVNAEVIAEGTNGFIANDEEEWESKLEPLITNSALRDRVGQEGRRTVEARYSLASAASKLMRILTEINRPRAISAGA